ncbi:TPM domain-containing protein [Cohnella cholangitidis]|uniref:TPM domain-containing protein n=1 Tax=Cohnella cholangitidis TaxID=2598458 RepID=A0A7G5C1M9_9BACL|nr:TPM domain-containing protein [Cohnella cholangitidis]QMV43113.1 TPM domain-containing protein [Cohnella cholangitidis]
MAAPRFNVKRLSASMLLLAFVSMLTMAAGAVQAQTDTRYGVYVQDEAGVISAQTRDELYRRAVWLFRNTGSAQIGVVTVSSLDGQTLEELAVAKFRKLGLGSKERNDGVLLLYSASERHVRMEVGYGLEGRIPDGKAGAILDQYFVPNRDSNRLDAAFAQTQSAILNEIGAEYGLDTSGVIEADMPPLGAREEGGFFAGMPGYAKVLLGLAIVLLVVFDFKFTGGAITYAILNMLGRRGGSGGGGGGRGGGGSSGGGGASR